MEQAIRQAALDGEVFATLVWKGAAREPFIIFVKTLSESGFIFDQADTWPAFLGLPGQTLGYCAFLNHAHENWLIRSTNRVDLHPGNRGTGLPGRKGISVCGIGRRSG